LKRLAVVLALILAPLASAQYVTDVPVCVITSTGTSVNSSTVAECNGNAATGTTASGLPPGAYTIRCDAATILRQATTTTATVAAGSTLATMGFTIQAQQPWPFGVSQTGEGASRVFFAIISVSGTANCGVFRAVSG
jgi:hypothetical protein